jgi:hypothetical protein
MTAQVVDSTGTRPINRCLACIQRERKALERRLKSQKLGAESSASNIQRSEVSTGEQEKILQFYCESFVDFASGEATFPLRITCYCRHHKERYGFGIRISLYDMSSGAMVKNFFL